MSYALNGVWSSGVGMNAPLYAGPTDLTDRAKQRNFNAIVKYWIQQGNTKMYKTLLMYTIIN